MFMFSYCNFIIIEGSHFYQINWQNSAVRYKIIILALRKTKQNKNHTKP